MYVPQTRKILSSYAVASDENVSSALAYTSQPYAEAMAMLQAVSYTPYATSSREQTGNINTFTQFEERDLLSETRENRESGDKSNDNSTMPPIISNI